MNKKEIDCQKNHKNSDTFNQSKSVKTNQDNQSRMYQNKAMAIGAIFLDFNSPNSFVKSHN